MTTNQDSSSDSKDTCSSFIYVYCDGMLSIVKGAIDSFVIQSS